MAEMSFRGIHPQKPLPGYPCKATAASEAAGLLRFDTPHHRRAQVCYTQRRGGAIRGPPRVALHGAAGRRPTCRCAASTSAPFEDVRVTRFGYPIRTSSNECAQKLDEYYDESLSHGRKTCPCLQQALKADAECVIVRALGAAEFLPDWWDELERYLVNATEYERDLASALKHLVRTDDLWDEDLALERLEEFLKKYPKDINALKKYQMLCFDMGLPWQACSILQQVEHQNINQNYYYGLLAFALVETGRVEKAERVALQGLAINGADLWAQHALSHALHFKCRFSDVVTFMEGCSHGWAHTPNSMMLSHSWWHVALAYLEGGAPTDRVTDVYLNRIRTAGKGTAQHYVDVLGLLLRMALVKKQL